VFVRALDPILFHLPVLVVYISVRGLYGPQITKGRYCAYLIGASALHGHVSILVAIQTHDSNSLTNSKALLKIGNVSYVPTGYLPGTECRYI